MKRGHSNMDTQVYQVSVMFHDVAACFSAEEWSALEDWQKDLYKKVMMEIHSALQGMGFEILNPEVLFRIKKVKDLYIDIADADRTVNNSACSQRESVTGVKQEPRPNLDSCRRRGGKTTRHPACTPDLLLRINQDDASCYRDLPPQSPAHSAADTTVPSVFSKQKDSEEKRKESRPVERPEVRINQSHRQITSQPIKQEKLDYIKVSVGEQNRNSTMVTTRGQMTSHTMKPDDDYTKAPMRSQGSESTGAVARGQVTLKPIKQEVDYIKVAVGSQRSDDASPSRVTDNGEPPKGDIGAAPQFPVNQIPNLHGSHLPSSSSPGAPRLRIVKFTEKELDVLVDLVLENYSKLFGKESDITPSIAKNAMWQAIANEVSGVGVASRTSDKVKKRWKNAKRKMNEKLREAAAHVAETGRRPPPHLRLAPYEQRLRDFFKPEFSKEVDWNQDKEDQPEEVEADPIDLVHSENLEDTVFSPPMDLVHQKSLADTIFSPPMDLVHQKSLADTIFSPPMDLVHQKSLADTIFSPPMDLVHQKSLADTIFSPPMVLVHREFLAEAVFTPAIDSVHQESLANNVFSPQCQELGEDSSKDSSEERSIISPGDQLHCSDTMEEQEPVLEPEHQDRHFSVLNQTLHNLSSNQQESNVLMQEQNSILSQIAYSLSLLHIQQTEGLAALGNIIQQGVEAIHPASCVSTNTRTIDPAKVHTGLRRPVMGINRSSTDLPAPPKRKIT
ncbi:uncharacterized protein LOC120936061 isoform X2 [Rana temporaria]|uniref:uncharacterized protein LOC120936061 isoform X2 n=1 Tax=Rana temporaria TaxID=8407 RepID=UPI001AADAB23|nr:uncharacterized protein LOC120936061 isoform X2 [Rana temporaria]